MTKRWFWAKVQIYRKPKRELKNPVRLQMAETLVVVFFPVKIAIERYRRNTLWSGISKFVERFKRRRGENQRINTLFFITDNYDCSKRSSPKYKEQAAGRADDPDPDSTTVHQMYAICTV